jgi:hypothetical protein
MTRDTVLVGSVACPLRSDSNLKGDERALENEPCHTDAPKATTDFDIITVDRMLDCPCNSLDLSLMEVNDGGKVPAISQEVDVVSYGHRGSEEYAYSTALDVSLLEGVTGTQPVCPSAQNDQEIDVVSMVDRRPLDYAQPALLGSILSAELTLLDETSLLVPPSVGGALNDTEALHELSHMSHPGDETLDVVGDMAGLQHTPPPGKVTLSPLYVETERTVQLAPSAASLVVLEQAPELVPPVLEKALGALNTSTGVVPPAPNTVATGSAEDQTPVPTDVDSFIASISVAMSPPILTTTPKLRTSQVPDYSVVPRRSTRLADKPKASNLEVQATRVMLKKLGNDHPPLSSDESGARRFRETFSGQLSSTKKEAMRELFPARRRFGSRRVVE